MFSVMYGNSGFSSVLAMGDKSYVCYGLFLVLKWGWLCTFPEMEYCVSVEGNVAHVCEMRGTEKSDL